MERGGKSAVTEAAAPASPLSDEIVFKATNPPNPQRPGPGGLRNDFWRQPDSEPIEPNPTAPEAADSVPVVEYPPRTRYSRSDRHNPFADPTDQAKPGALGGGMADYEAYGKEPVYVDLPDGWNTTDQGTDEHGAEEQGEVEPSDIEPNRHIPEWLAESLRIPPIAVARFEVLYDQYAKRGASGDPIQKYLPPTASGAYSEEQIEVAAVAAAHAQVLAELRTIQDDETPDDVRGQTWLSLYAANLPDARRQLGLDSDGGFNEDAQNLAARQMRGALGYAPDWTWVVTALEEAAGGADTTGDVPASDSTAEASAGSAADGEQPPRIVPVLTDPKDLAVASTQGGADSGDPTNNGPEEDDMTDYNGAGNATGDWNSSDPLGPGGAAETAIQEDALRDGGPAMADDALEHANPWAFEDGGDTQVPDVTSDQDGDSEDGAGRAAADEKPVYVSGEDHDAAADDENADDSVEPAAEAEPEVPDHLRDLENPDLDDEEFDDGLEHLSAEDDEDRAALSYLDAKFAGGLAAITAAIRNFAEQNDGRTPTPAEIDEQMARDASEREDRRTRHAADRLERAAAVAHLAETLHGQADAHGTSAQEATRAATELEEQIRALQAQLDGLLATAEEEAAQASFKRGLAGSYSSRVDAIRSKYES